eukprot:gb/GEZN01000697.1/.p1 GENE.gb/GEZN01000697.1/~~gb/GEZN01000697.1/.p1  ORF type:complete len:997 (-),score=74.77 gb/GEZN01000697.1/:644-3634(-)
MADLTMQSMALCKCFGSGSLFRMCTAELRLWKLEFWVCHLSWALSLLILGLVLDGTQAVMPVTALCFPWLIAACSFTLILWDFVFSQSEFSQVEKLEYLGLMYLWDIAREANLLTVQQDLLLEADVRRRERRARVSATGNDEGGEQETPVANVQIPIPKPHFVLLDDRLYLTLNSERVILQYNLIHSFDKVLLLYLPFSVPIIVCIWTGHSTAIGFVFLVYFFVFLCYWLSLGYRSLLGRGCGGFTLCRRVRSYVGQQCSPNNLPFCLVFNVVVLVWLSFFLVVWVLSVAAWTNGEWLRSRFIQLRIVVTTSVFFSLVFILWLFRLRLRHDRSISRMLRRHVRVIVSALAFLLSMGLCFLKAVRPWSVSSFHICLAPLWTFEFLDLCFSRRLLVEAKYTEEGADEVTPSTHRQAAYESLWLLFWLDAVLFPPGVLILVCSLAFMHSPPLWLFPLYKLLWSSLFGVVALQLTGLALSEAHPLNYDSTSPYEFSWPRFVGLTMLFWCRVIWIVPCLLGLFFGGFSSGEVPVLVCLDVVFNCVWLFVFLRYWLEVWPRDKVAFEEEFELHPAGKKRSLISALGVLLGVSSPVQRQDMLLLCVLCRKRPSDAFNYPCGHMFTCMSCALSLRADVESPQPSEFTPGRDRTCEGLVVFHSNTASERRLPETLQQQRRLSVPPAPDSKYQTETTHRGEHSRDEAEAKHQARLDQDEPETKHRTEPPSRTEPPRAEPLEGACPTCHQVSVLRPVISSMECSICLTTHSRDLVVTSIACGHMLCVLCVVNQIREAKKDANKLPLKCCVLRGKDDAPCGVVLDVVKDLRRIMVQSRQLLPWSQRLSPKELDQIESMELQRAVGPHGKCPIRGCKQFFALGDNNRNEVTEMTCTIGHHRCFKCSCFWHAGESCDDYQSKRSGRKTKEQREREEKLNTDAILNDKEIKICPGCQTAISKNGGCRHMTCTTCKAHFCWLCGKRFASTQSTYDHLNDEHGGISDRDGTEL